LDEKANKNGILLPESLVRMPFCIPALGICVDFQKCVDFWFRLKKCVDLRRFFSFVGLYQSRQGFFADGYGVCSSLNYISFSPEPQSAFFFFI